MPEALYDTFTRTEILDRTIAQNLSQTAEAKDQGLTAQEQASVETDAIFALLGLIRNKYPWMQYARCKGVDPDLFFPEQGGSSIEAIEVCSGCPVREDCLEHSLANHEKYGVWGGATEKQRRRIKRERKLRRLELSELIEVSE